MSKISITINGFPYVQRGSDIVAAVKAGIIPPPYRDLRVRRKLGPYLLMIAHLLEEDFTFAAIHEIFNRTMGFRVSYLTVINFCKATRITNPIVRRSLLRY